MPLEQVRYDCGVSRDGSKAKNILLAAKSYGFKGRFAYINDPARGEVRVSMDEFDQSFTGITLSITPGEDFEPSGKRKSTFEFAMKRLSGMGATIAFLVISSVIAYLFGIIDPLFSKFFMDRLLTGENRELLMPFTGLLPEMGRLSGVS